jgi:hypothetical protein
LHTTVTKLQRGACTLILPSMCDACYLGGGARKQMRLLGNYLNIRSKTIFYYQPQLHACNLACRMWHPLYPVQPSCSWLVALHGPGVVPHLAHSTARAARARARPITLLRLAPTALLLGVAATTGLGLGSGMLPAAGAGDSSAAAGMTSAAGSRKGDRRTHRHQQQQASASGHTVPCSQVSMNKS